MFYLRYHYYRIYFPLMALARWARRGGEKEMQTANCRIAESTGWSAWVFRSLKCGPWPATCCAKRLRGEKRYPLVLMLEPLFRCNLACAGCGKIQHPAEILRRHLTPEQCFRAADECGAPVVSIPGGEPLLHPQIDEIVAGLVARRKYVYLCTNAIKLEEALPRFKPSKYFSFSIHLDGPREQHDAAVAAKGSTTSPCGRSGPPWPPAFA